MAFSDRFGGSGALTRGTNACFALATGSLSLLAKFSRCDGEFGQYSHATNEFLAEKQEPLQGRHCLLCAVELLERDKGLAAARQRAHRCYLLNLRWMSNVLQRAVSCLAVVGKNGGKRLSQLLLLDFLVDVVDVDGVVGRQQLGRHKVVLHDGRNLKRRYRFCRHPNAVE